MITLNRHSLPPTSKKGLNLKQTNKKHSLTTPNGLCLKQLYIFLTFSLNISFIPKLIRKNIGINLATGAAMHCVEKVTYYIYHYYWGHFYRINNFACVHICIVENLVPGLSLTFA